MAAGKAIQAPQPGLPGLHGQRKPCSLWNPASGSRSIELSYGNNGSEIREIRETRLPGRRWRVLPLHPLEDHPRQPPTHASAIMQSWLQAVSTWLRLWYEILESTVASRLRLPRPHGFADSISLFSGIHPHLPQRRGDAYPLPSPVATGADGCTVPGTRSALALGAAHARLSAIPQ